MTDKTMREVLTGLLEALRNTQLGIPAIKAVAAAELALAQREAQEPAFYRVCVQGIWYGAKLRTTLENQLAASGIVGAVIEPLYTAAPAREVPDDWLEILQTAPPIGNCNTHGYVSWKKRLDALLASKEGA